MPIASLSLAGLNLLQQPRIKGGFNNSANEPQMSTHDSLCAIVSPPEDEGVYREHFVKHISFTVGHKNI